MMPSASTISKQNLPLQGLCNSSYGPSKGLLFSSLVSVTGWDCGTTPETGTDAGGGCGLTAKYY